MSPVQQHRPLLALLNEVETRRVGSSTLRQHRRPSPKQIRIPPTQPSMRKQQQWWIQDEVKREVAREVEDQSSNDDAAPPPRNITTHRKVRQAAEVDCAQVIVSVISTSTKIDVSRTRRQDVQEVCAIASSRARPTRRAKDETCTGPRPAIGIVADFQQKKVPKQKLSQDPNI